MLYVIDLVYHTFGFVFAQLRLSRAHCSKPAQIPTLQDGAPRPPTSTKVHLILSQSKRTGLNMSLFWNKFLAMA